MPYAAQGVKGTDGQINAVKLCLNLLVKNYNGLNKSNREQLCSGKHLTA